MSKERSHERLAAGERTAQPFSTATRNALVRSSEPLSNAGLRVDSGCYLGPLIAHGSSDLD